MSQHYSINKVKKSLIHFAFGKLGSGIIGLCLLILTVRALSPKEFGAYITLLSVFEIVQLVSTGGLFATTHRYITECRVKGSIKELSVLIKSSILNRVLTLLGSILLMGLFYSAVQQAIGTTLSFQLFLVFLVYVVAEGSARFTDLIFECLLLQAKGQTCIIARNGIKLTLLTIMYLVIYSKNSLATLMIIESFSSIFGFTVAILLIRNFIKKEKEQDQSPKLGYESTKKESGFALNLYFSQVVGLGYGPDMVRIIVAKFLGLVEAATFGFAYSVINMLRRYLPAQLLLGLIRPLFVVVDAKSSRGDDTEKMDRLNLMSNLVFKFNIFMLAPIIVFLYLYGDGFGEIFSHGKYPKSGELLVGFCFFLILQTLHVVLGLVTVALQNSSASLKGTILGLIGLPIGIYFSSKHGANGLMYGMMISEMMWCACVIYFLAKSQFFYKQDLIGAAKVIVASLLSMYPFMMFKSNVIHLQDYIMVGLELTVLFLFFSFILKPFSSDERNIINRLLPKPYFIW